MSLSDEQIARIAGWNDQFEASDWHETAIELARELQFLRASRRPDMSDEAVEAAQRCLDVRHALDFSVEDVHTIARALLSREAEIQKLRERLEIAHVWQMVDGTMTRVPAPEGEEIPDGIECRDETIKLQDQRIAELTAAKGPTRPYIEWRAEMRRERENEIIERCAVTVEAGIPRYMPGTWPAVALETAAERVRTLKTAGEP